MMTTPPPGRYRIRTVEWCSDESYLQGYGIAWDEIEIDLSDGEFVLYCEKGVNHHGFDLQTPKVCVWIAAPLAPGASA